MSTGPLSSSWSRGRRIAVPAAATLTAALLAAAAGAADPPATPDPATVAPYAAPPIVIVARTRLVGAKLRITVNCPPATGGCRGSIRLWAEDRDRTVGLGARTLRIPQHRTRILTLAVPAAKRARMRALLPAAAVRSRLRVRSGSGARWSGRFVTELRIR